MTIQEKTIEWFTSLKEKFIGTEYSIYLDAAIQALKQQPSEDCISREAVLVKLNRIGVTAFESYSDYSELFDFIDKLPPVTPRTNLVETSQDCISRQKAIDIVEFECGEWIGLAREISKQLRQLPSVPPQPRVGQWRHYEGMLICSECGAEFYDDIMEYCGDDVPKCCPNCGAKNGG